MLQRIAGIPQSDRCWVPSTDMSAKQTVLVVAIDFGTTYSGYAFSFTSNKSDVKTHLWQTGIGQERSTKAPTSILFDQWKRFQAFGYEAETTYTSLSDEQQSQFYFFKRFKMTLFQNKDLNQWTKMKDVSGKEMSAVDVFAAGIKYLRDHFYSILSSRVLRTKDTKWVLTVPAIWNEAAKQFMRQAAVQAGISSDCLTLALEPEAAALYCKTNVPLGGTVDVTVHKVRQAGKLQEVIPPSGGQWGGVKVDDAFQAFLLKVFGLAAIREMSKSKILQLEREFEIVKRSFGRKATTSATDIRIPYCLVRHLDPSKASRHSVRIRGDKLNVPFHVIEEFFKGPVRKIVAHVMELMDKPEVISVSDIYLVGGFSESQVLQSDMKQTFPSIRVHTPREANSAVIKGAVSFGHDPNIIGWRKSTCTYGISTCTNFDNTCHSREKYTVIEGKEYCSDVFSKLITIGTTIETGQATPFRSFRPIHKNQTGMTVEVVSSPSENPTYTTESGCRVLGRINVRMPNLTGDTDREVKVRMIMGGTELKVEAVDGNTGISYSAKFDCL
ncbi:heat shock 70 kDa protein 12A-like isoform X2 [Argopecten irradians]|uniref:heat shock 70 kDa protein 12A-like isoform X2 n=1 Tax=Argopecten irradians TaxID=31199 RepID=UPI00371EF4F5